MLAQFAPDSSSPGAVNVDNGAVALAGLGPIPYAVGGPIVHLVNGNGWRAGGSLLLRVGTPLVTGAIAASDCTNDGNCIDGVLAGFALGGIIASALDLSLLHWEETAPEASSAVIP